MAMDGTHFGAARTRPLPIICLSHLRWKSVFQRPQQLMTRFARDHEVWFFEEPEQHSEAGLRIATCPQSGVQIVTPILPDPDNMTALAGLLDQVLRRTGPSIGWYYTPMALRFSDHVAWASVVLDVMDELSAFRFAPAELGALEARLLRRADVVFTGGASLHAARVGRHRNIHCFPSGVDLPHFMAARGVVPEPADQVGLGRPLLGYFGVIDERLDMTLLAGMAALRPTWQFVMIGPVAKLAPEELPQAANIHWLGGRDYRDLPAYLAHWDVALMPFALNEATRWISPTKAPEYLAGGRRVVSTAITDVVHRFQSLDAVAIATDAAGFVAAAESHMERPQGAGFAAVDHMLKTMSWDGIRAAMASLIRPPALAAPAIHVTPAAIADYLVVGAGFAGAVAAERLASSGHKVLVVDRRPHVAGNAFDEYDAAGILVHRYGPHIFHTNSDEVLDYLSRFTAWHPYEHRVLARVAPRGTDILLPMPINRTTVNNVFGRDLRCEAEAEAFFASLAEPVADIKSARDFVVNAVGTRLYEMFFRGYTLKQWGVAPDQLDRSVTARVPTRFSDDDRYFLDKHQVMPKRGYTAMFENMLDHANITVLTGTDHAVIPHGCYGHMIQTGPIDAFYDHRFGALPYRSLRFEHETRDVEYAQPVGTINFPTMDTPYTRCSEFKHMTGQKHARTSLCRETSSAEGEPYYPVPNPANQALFKRYQALADAERDVTFMGRLGSYRYMNMDQVVAQSLATVRRMASAGRENAAAA